jgi:hypothetical protein
MILAITDSFGLLGIFSPSMWLYSFLSKIHPKYYFANKYFKIATNINEKNEI